MDNERFRDADGTGEPSYVLRRSGPGRYRLDEQFSYRDPHHPETRFTIPKDTATFDTDLGSIPRWFTWIVPTTGRYLPAMLLHDALVLSPGSEQTYDGPTVTRLEADRILRDAMKHLRTKRIQRWLVWAATAFATTTQCRKPRQWWRWFPYVWALVLIILGFAMSAYMLLGWTYGILPGAESGLDRAALGVLVALAVPAPVSWVLWRGQEESGRIGIIGGLAIAWLLWPMTLVGVAYGIYWILESIASRSEPDWIPATTLHPPDPDLDSDGARQAACEGRSPAGAGS